MARMATPADRVQFVRAYKKQKKRERTGVVEYRVENVCTENGGPKRCSPMKNRFTVSADTEANTDNCGPNYPHNCSLFAFTCSFSLSLPFFFFSSPVYAIHQESNFRSSTVVCNRAWNNVAQSFKNARYSFYYIKALVYQMLLRNNVNWDLLYQFLGKF